MQLKGSPTLRRQLLVRTSSRASVQRAARRLAAYSPFRVLHVEQQVHTVGMGDTISDIPHSTGTSPSEVWGFRWVQYRGPGNVGLCRDTKVGEESIPDSASSQVLENALAWPTEVSPYVLEEIILTAPAHTALLSAPSSSERPPGNLLRLTDDPPECLVLSVSHLAVALRTPLV